MAPHLAASSRRCRRLCADFVSLVAGRRDRWCVRDERSHEPVAGRERPGAARALCYARRAGRAPR